jgi:beta-mannosidase
MRRIDLAGEWAVRKAGTKKSVPAAVPGCVHADLIAARELEDAFSRKRLDECGWVLASEWVYEKLFVAEDLSVFDRVVLRFEGLDTCAAISLNDVELGRTANAFEAFEYEVKQLVKSGKNRLSVTFAPAEGARAEGRRSQASVQGVAGQPTSPTVGIWRGVSLLAFTGVRVSDVQIRQDFAVPGVVGLDVSVEAERFDPAVHLEILVRVCYKGNILHEARDILGNERAALHLNIKNPQLWWPAGLGDQPLYEVTVDILAGRACLEHVSRRIGLRHFAVEVGEEGGMAACRFFINSHPLFLKGASWLPADLYAARLTRVEYARLIKAAAVANMNILRVWGGGVYENDSFYDLCDEYGVCVWQDLMLCEAQADRPDAATLASFAREAAQNVRRLRHHPCLALWCGGDGGGRGVAEPYRAAAAAAVGEADPDRPFLPAAPHAPFSLGGAPAFAPLPSYPEPRVVATYLNDEERNLNHPACTFHVSPPGGTQRVYEGFIQHFLIPTGFDNALCLSQIQQGWTLKLQMERTRASERPGTGFVFWHLNDSWPVCSPSSVDAGGRWKALHYMARRFFSPLWLCGDYRAASGSVDVYAFNDGVKAFKGELQWRITQMDGAVAAEGAKKVSLSPASREKPVAIKAGELVRKLGAGNLLLWLYLLDEQGNQTAWNFVLFCEPLELALQPPRMRAEIRNWDDNSFAVTLTSHHPAMWVWISLEGMDARYDENYFCMEPEKPVRVRVTPASRIKLDQFRQLIRIGSLRDTWQEKRNLMQMMAAPKK